LIASDADFGETVSYSIAGGDDSALFTIDGSTGELKFLAAPNAEAPADTGGDNIYEVTVRASDGTNNDDQTLSVTVTGVDEFAPVITSNGGAATASINFLENDTAAVTTVTATDADVPAETLTYSISGADAALFTIVAATGQLTFKAAPDFENKLDAGADNVYNVTVTVTDSGALTDSQDLAITVFNLKANADNIIYGHDSNTTTITIPRWALLFNDTDPDNPGANWYDVINNSWTISTVNSVVGTAALAAPDVTYKGLAAGSSGSFTYALTGSASTTVATQRSSNDTTVTGTNGNDILIGGKTNTTYNLSGGDGNDVLIGNDKGTGDTLTGGEGSDVYFGGVGTDTLILTETTAMIDYVRLDTVTGSGDADTMTGFLAGAGSTRDVVILSDANTTNATTGVQLSSAAGAATYTLDFSLFDIFEFAFDVGTDANLGTGGSNALMDGLDPTVTSGGGDDAVITVAANGKGYIVAYDGGNAYLYYFADTGNGTLAANEIQMIGAFNTVAVGAFDATNFVLV
jgi:hypothetical protein